MNSQKIISRQDLLSLEKYSAERSQFRERIMAHKSQRRLSIGPNATLYFEDMLTIKYQVQEMLRIEKIFEPEEIQQELDSYNPLIPDGTNLKATFMLEYPDVEERQIALRKLIGIERKIWLDVSGHNKIYSIANEDISRESSEKTSAVHFLRFELTPEEISKFTSSDKVRFGINHPEYEYSLTMSDTMVKALTEDFYL